jgi:HEPN domain-containing protein
MGDSLVSREWFRFASLDLESAFFLKNMHPVPVEIICYHCQQCAEKMLKGFLALHDRKIRKTHDLTLLYKDCCGINESLKSIEEECINLTDFSVNTRYPYSLEIVETDMVKALDDAKRVRNFVLGIV